MPGGGGGGLQLSCHGNDIAMGRQAKRLWGFPATVSPRELMVHPQVCREKAVAIFDGESAAPAARTTTFWRAGPILLEREAAL